MLFMSKTKRNAEKLVNKVIRFAKITANQESLFPTGVDTQHIECVLVGLTAFLVCGFANDVDLGLELVPTYQKRIMHSVSQKTYNERTQCIQNCFGEYRETAIQIQESMNDWFVPLVEKFAEMTAGYYGIEFSKDCHDTLCACILELINTVNPKLGV